MAGKEKLLASAVLVFTSVLLAFIIFTGAFYSVDMNGNSVKVSGEKFSSFNNEDRFASISQNYSESEIFSTSADKKDIHYQEDIEFTFSLSLENGNFTTGGGEQTVVPFILNIECDKDKWENPGLQVFWDFGDGSDLVITEDIESGIMISHSFYSGEACSYTTMVKLMLDGEMLAQSAVEIDLLPRLETASELAPVINPVIDSDKVVSEVGSEADDRTFIYLVSSNDIPLSGGLVEYYDGEWKSLGTTGTEGYVTTNLVMKSYTFRMKYANSSLTKYQDLSSERAVIFQTINTTIEFVDSTGSPLDSDNVRYYSDGWHGFGSTVNGTVIKELLPAAYYFDLTYGHASVQTYQDISVDPVVHFQTVNTTVEFVDSTGSPLDSDNVRYYSGGWHGFGSTVNGTVIKELLPAAYYFDLTYGHASVQTYQDVSVDPIVNFQTVNTTVEFVDSTVSPLDSDNVRYYSGGWHGFGSTVNGTVIKELLPAAYYFDLTYGHASVQTYQDVSVDPIVHFQTVNTTVEFVDSTGSPLDSDNVRYYSGGWYDFGSTVNGTVIKELLPAAYYFDLTYGHASVQTYQDISVDPIVHFQTVNTTVEFVDSTGSPLDSDTVRYHSGGWYDFGSTVNGTVIKELLPAAYYFDLTYGHASVQTYQDISVDPVVHFQTVNTTVEFVDSTGSPLDSDTVRYHSGTWYDFGSTVNGSVSKELLPAAYYFDLSYGHASVQTYQDISVDPVVHFQTVNTTVEFVDSTGSPLDSDTVRYHSGTWYDFGSTVNGSVSKELLPTTYYFDLSYGHASVQTYQDISVDPVVHFQTVNTTVEFVDVDGFHVDTGVVNYYSGSWYDFGSTVNGTVSKELLPTNYYFNMMYDGRSKEVYQNIDLNENIIFVENELS